MENKTQTQFQLDVNAKANINIVTCGDCGEVFMHEINNNEVELTCPNCGLTDDASSFPDLYY